MKLPDGIEVINERLDRNAYVITVRLRWVVAPFVWSIWGFGVAGAWSRDVVRYFAIVTPWRAWSWGDITMEVS